MANKPVPVKGEHLIGNLLSSILPDGGEWAFVFTHKEYTPIVVSSSVNLVKYLRLVADTLEAQQPDVRIYGVDDEQ